METSTIKELTGMEERYNFLVTAKPDGDVYINGKFFSQLCFTPEAVGMAVSDYLNGIDPDDEDNSSEGGLR